jgi:hypothetical protein
MLTFFNQWRFRLRRLLGCAIAPKVSVAFHIIFLVTIVLLGGCASKDLRCWQNMQDDYFALNVLQQEGRLGEPDTAETRARLQKTLKRCASTASKESVLQGPFGGQQGYVSLLDIAVSADDSIMTKEFLARGLSPTGNAANPDQHLYGANSLQLAARLEASNSTAVLLAAGTDAGLTDAEGFAPLHFTGSQTAAGLVVMRLLVEYGAEIDKASRSGVTPMMMARVNGDLRKVQCLVRMGARQPTQDELALLPIKQPMAARIAAVDQFLQGAAMETAPDVVASCPDRKSSP